MITTQNQFPKIINESSLNSRNDFTDQSNLLGAKNDYEAFALFIHRAGARSSETQRRYYREIYRFTVFLYEEIGISYPLVKMKHILVYFHFIQNLPDNWVNCTQIQDKPKMPLFHKSVLQGKSMDQIINVLSAFFSFLVKGKYIAGNPMASIVRSGETIAKGAKQVRYFYKDEWLYVKKCLSNPVDSYFWNEKEKKRTQYIITICYSLALRESELSQHGCEHLSYDDTIGCYVEIIGKGRKKRILPINKPLQEKILSYKLLFGITSLSGDNFPFSPKIRVCNSNNIPSSLSSRGIRFWWGSFMKYCAQNTDNQDLASRLLAMPFHALRHTALTHLAKSLRIEDLAIFAGHQSIHTTAQYYHVEVNRISNLTKNHVL